MFDRLRKSRLEKNLSQKRIGEMIGISESYYCQLENGVRRMSLPIAKKLAIVLEGNLNDLFMPHNLADCNEDAGVKE